MNRVSSSHLLAKRLPRSLSSFETWGFGLTGNICWIGNAPIIHAALGPQAIFVWLPGVIVSILLNLQVQRLGRYWPEMAGGTPNYTARLLKKFPGLSRYVALSYFIGWAAVPAVYAIILTDLIEANLEPLGITCPKAVFKIGFTALAFIVGFSGTRALGILHLFFVIPAVAFLLAFCFQGLGWLAFSPTSPGFFPSTWSSLSFGEWAKWFFISTFSVYSCETAASFVADSRRPSETLRFLSFAAWLIPPVYLGGSWVLMQLATQPETGDPYLYSSLLAAAQPFWGQTASFFVTLLIAFDCLLSSATAVSNTPRILYQLALDKHLAPVFAVVSRRGVLEPALILTCLISFLFLALEELSSIFLVSSTNYLVSIMGIHLGLWLQRGRPEVRWPWWSLSFFVVEAVVLIIGGLAWNWQVLVLGLLFPIIILAVDTAVRHISLPLFHPQWWFQRYYAKAKDNLQDFVALQVVVLLLLICSAATISWFVSGKLDRTSGESSADLLVVLLVTLSFIGVAIACWTTLPQIASIDEAGQQAKNLFTTALETVPDTILILDEKGIIVQANPAAEELFQMNIQNLLGAHLSKFFSCLVGSPEQWSNQSEPIIEGCYKSRVVEFTLSQPSNQAVKPFIIILRDITKRKQAEVDIRSALIKEKELNELKSRFVRMASHEFRTPLTTILFSTGILQEYGDNFSTEKNLQYLQRIQVAIEQMNQLLNNVLLIDKAEAGKLEFNPAKFDLIQFCRNLIDEIQISINTHNINFVHHSNYINVCLDEKLLWHILNNLLSNSIKYSPQGGNVNINLVYEQDQVLFQIQDWGIGIPTADQTKLFDSFYRGDNVGIIPGTGLGLAIVKKAVDLHNGRIRVISKVGLGTTFTVSLPLNMPAN